VSAQTIGLLLSNVLMTFAWYGHLKDLATSPWFIAALVSWGIALFEYLLQVPGNRIGFTQFSVGQLKIMQEIITLAVFVPFAVFCMHEDSHYFRDGLRGCDCLLDQPADFLKDQSARPGGFGCRRARERLSA
jgi:uncharacterized protein